MNFMMRIKSLRRKYKTVQNDYGEPIKDTVENYRKVTGVEGDEYSSPGGGRLCIGCEDEIPYGDPAVEVRYNEEPNRRFFFHPNCLNSSDNLHTQRARNHGRVVQEGNYTPPKKKG